MTDRAEHPEEETSKTLGVLLEECARRLDHLLPEEDAAVFLANFGGVESGWEGAFVEAIAIAHKSTDALARAPAFPDTMEV